MSNKILDPKLTSRQRVGLLLLNICHRITKYTRYRGFGIATRQIKNLFNLENVSAVVSVHENLKCKIQLDDHYWLPIVFSHYEYEPEISCILDKLLNSNVSFLDCGANIGYWTLFAGDRIGNPKQAIAVEASGSTLKKLKENCEINQSNFTAIQNAISETSGQVLEFLTVGDRHAGAFIKGAKDLSESENFNSEKVESICIDDICKQYLNDFTGPLVLKVDVEGHEVSALKGAKRVLKQDVLIIFEDLGNGAEIRDEILKNGDYKFFTASPIGSINILNTDQDFHQARQESYDSALNVFALKSGYFSSNLDLNF